VVYLGALSQGDGTTARDGNSVKLKGAVLRLQGTMHTSATRTLVRILVVMDMRNAGANPSISDILVSSTVTALPNLVAEPNRYVILHDQVFQMAITGQQSLYTAISLESLIDAHLMYSGTAGTVADAAGPAPFLVMISTEPTNTPSVSGSARILFLDN
jgi:hypothetical protein